MRNRLFFAQSALDEWLALDRVELTRDELTLRPEGRRFRLLEAVHILREVTGAPDPQDLVGRVKTRAYLAELGAELLEGSMILGDCAYDVAPGFIGAPAPGAVRYSDPSPADPWAEENALRAFLAGG